ncbi:sulfotransferase [Novosphingobium malaysiense]|uniref:sulfotransferase n=1 Tax=Novosphingobium malaysiense TaxID=1348853 RepID=UPI000A3E597D|nr:sulfotransferase [Novosphingobium malaysiense]
MARDLLESASIIQSAEIASGTHGLVDEGLRSRVESLIRALDAGDAAPERQIATRRQIVRLLARRLSIEADVRRHPEILEEDIVGPVCVIGFPRTGTSIQHALLAADPAHRAIEAWRVHEPSPPPGGAAPAPARKAAADRVVQHFCDQCPGIMPLHPYWDALGSTLIEDEEILTLDFQDNYPVALCDAPTLAIREGGGDRRDAYVWLKRFLQHQQWQAPRRRWVLKGVEHQRHLDDLFAVFPDARCLFPHREPEAFLPSNLAIAAVVYDGITLGGLPRPVLAQGYLADFRQRIDTLLADPAMDDPRVTHMAFSAFMADPVAALRECYADWGLDWSEAAEAAMRGWLADPANSGDRYGRHSYTFEPFAVDWASLSADFDAYRARFLGG